MAYTAREFDNVRELTDYLNGVVSGKFFASNQPVFGLHGLTLIIHDGTAARTTTFADAAGDGLRPKEILDQIRAAHANMANVSLRDYGHSSPPKAKVVVEADTYYVDKTGSANTILGFSVAANSTVAAMVQANIVSIFHLENQRIGVLHV